VEHQRLLHQADTPLRLNHPTLAPLAIAFYRVLFASLVLLPVLRRRDLSFRPVMIVMVACFAVMNALFVSAMALGTVANAILLQYTAPMWMYLASIWLLGEPADRRSSVALLTGLAGIAVIVAGGWEGAQLPVVAIALGSGVTYAGVMICLRVLRHASSPWLALINLLVAAAALVPWLWRQGQWQVTPEQLAVLLVFGVFQMGLSYWLVARGLRVVSPQEAGAITLLEPLLNPVWAYLVAGEEPGWYTYVGGALILGGLAWRYWPRSKSTPRTESADQ